MDEFEIPEETLEKLWEKAGEFAKREMKKRVSKEKQRKVKQRIPLRPEWENMYKELLDIGNEMRALMYKAKHLRNKMWVKIEEDTHIYDDMHYNDGEKVIEVMESDNMFTDSDEQ